MSVQHIAFFLYTFILKANLHAFRGCILVKPGASRVKKKKKKERKKERKKIAELYGRREITENMTEKKKNYER